MAIREIQTEADKDCTAYGWRGQGVKFRLSIVVLEKCVVSRRSCQ